MFKIIGKIEFDPINVSKKHVNQSTWKKTVMVRFKCDTADYYSWFLKKRFGLYLNKPLRGTHFTIINDIVDDKLYEQARELFNGKNIEITYDPTIIRSNDKGHWWIKAYSDDAQNLRNVMGLDKPFFGSHITLGLATHLQLDISRYVTEQCIKYNI